MADDMPEGKSRGSADSAGVRRAAVMGELVAALRCCSPGSRVTLRGSLAAGTADRYSDIDLAWTVPDNEFPRCVERVAGYVHRVHPLLSVRSDPDFQNSAARRLLFFLFRDLPLFWRLDLEIWSASIAGNHDYDRNNAAARGDDWSLTASALANAVAAIKAFLRDRPEDARGLLDRGFRRIGEADRATDDCRADVVRLARAAARRDPTIRPLAERIVALAVGAH